MHLKNRRRPWTWAGVACVLVGFISAVLSTPAEQARAAASEPASRPATTQGFLWKVSSPTNTVYLLGSVHVATKEMYPLPKEMEAAFAASKTLVVEVDVNNADQMAMMALVTKLGMYPAEDSLDKHLSAETMKALKDYCTEQKMQVDVLMQLKPWMVGLTMASLAIQKSGMDASLGIDKHFLDTAKDKKIVELESIDSQIKLLAGMSDKMQDAWLLMTTKESAKFTEMLGKLVKAWRAGDVKMMEKLMKEGYGDDEDSHKLWAAMVDDRNVKMEAKVEELLKDKDPAFVVVGAAHLIGDKGVLKLLEKAHYKVERVDLTLATPEK